MKKRMNVIVVACNAWHIGFLGPYGNAWIETPNIDRLAAEGIVFDHHYPENLTTLPTRRSWWTGRYGLADAEKGWTPLGADEEILPDLLWNQGVRTALISDVPPLREAGQGYGRGFDEVVWVRGQGYDPWIVADDPRARGVRLEDEPGLRLPAADDPDFELWKSRWEQYLRNRAALGLNREETCGAARTVDQAIAWLERNQNPSEPFLLWLDLFQPHGPWDPPQPYRDQYAAIDPDQFALDEQGDVDVDDESFRDDPAVLIDVPPGPIGDLIDDGELLRLRRTYAGTVTLVDRHLGRLFRAVESLGRADDSLIVFTADQGEPLGEHGYVRRFRPWLYEELIHTPLILRLPGGERGGTRQQSIVQTVDLSPTILAALGLPASEKAHGADLIALVRGRSPKIRDYACMGMDVEEMAIRTHLWHLIVPIASDPDEDPPRVAELFRKPEDRWEQNDVIAEYPEVAEHLELTLRRFVEAIGRDAPTSLPFLRDVVRFTAQ